MENKVIQVDLSIFDLVKAGEITPEADAEIKKLMDLKTVVDQMVEFVKGRLALAMEREELSEIASQNFVISLKPSGGKFTLDPTSSVSSQFLRNVAYSRIDNRKVEAFRGEHNGLLPPGIIANPRPIVVKIEERNDHSHGEDNT